MTIPARRGTQQQFEPADFWRSLIPFTLTLLGLAMLSDGRVGGGLFWLVVGGCGLVWANLRGKQLREAREAQALQAEIQALQSTEVARYHVMNPRQFEEAIAYLCQRDGCSNATVVGGAGDLGADVVATAPDGRRIVIQCKRYGPTTKVGSPDLQRFGGTCFTVHGAAVAAVVTTNVFTAPAEGYARQHGIRLFDERALAAWASRTGPAPWM
ncbi:restriction endonuclease [Streptomyces sp. NPDC056728]